MPQSSSFKKKKQSSSNTASQQLAALNFKKKQIAKNRHGKRIETRKGQFLKKTNKLTDNLKASIKITREVNLKNELEFARRATSSGGTLRVIKAPEGTEKGDGIKGPRPKKQKPVVKIGKGGKRM
jgi:hypothetical protein